ncbi:hypothetical protein YC2023_087820 [Brassica napus]
MALISVSIGSVGLSVSYRSCSIHCFKLEAEPALNRSGPNLLNNCTIVSWNTCGDFNRSGPSLLYNSWKQGRPQNIIPAFLSTFSSNAHPPPPPPPPQVQEQYKKGPPTLILDTTQKASLRESRERTQS